MSKKPNCSLCSHSKVCILWNSKLHKNIVVHCAIWNKEHGIYNEPGKPKLVLKKED